MAIVFIKQIGWAVNAVSDAVGIAADDYTLKLAVFHTIFNVLGVVLMAPFARKLVAFLERTLPAPELDVVTPKYINAAVQDFPETLYEAVHNETLHLFDNAFEVMVRGLGFEPDLVRSNESLFGAAKKLEKLPEYDIDTEYETKVKVLQAAILDFISQSRTRMPDSVSRRIYRLRQACTDIVRSVKAVKHLRKNVEEYVGSDNDNIRRLYNTSRVRIATILRKIAEFREADEETWDVLALDEIKLSVQHEGAVIDKALDRMIEDGRISADMASSLMNDHVYVKEAAWILADVGKELFGSRDAEEAEAQDLLLLDEDEIERLIETGRVSRSTLPPPPKQYRTRIMKLKKLVERVSTTVESERKRRKKLASGLRKLLDKLAKKEQKLEKRHADASTEDERAAAHDSLMLTRVHTGEGTRASGVARNRSRRLSTDHYLDLRDRIADAIQRHTSTTANAAAIHMYSVGTSCFIGNVWVTTHRRVPAMDIELKRTCRKMGAASPPVRCRAVPVARPIPTAEATRMIPAPPFKSM